MKEFTFPELVNLTGQEKWKLKTRYNVVSYLIGYNGAITIQDWQNINKLYLDGFVDA